ncbi:MAG TPA: hypothetical protein VFB72_06470 [Verrucomicrobiae bacterium]|nr:hypothetical protein [Verrucomicrobiae bacterium]
MSATSGKAGGLRERESLKAPSSPVFRGVCLLWAEMMYGSDGQFPQVSPALIQGDMHGNIYLAGNFTGGFFGNVHVPALNNNQAFLMKMNGPRLNIQLSGNQAIISWPTNATGLSLESSTDPTSTHWSPVTDTRGIVGPNYSVTNSIAAGANSIV